MLNRSHLSFIAKLAVAVMQVSRVAVQPCGLVGAALRIGSCSNRNQRHVKARGKGEPRRRSESVLLGPLRSLSAAADTRLDRKMACTSRSEMW